MIDPSGGKPALRDLTVERSNTSRVYLSDVATIAVISSLRVLGMRLRGLEYAGSDLSSYFIPNLAWWWSEWRGLAGWNPWVFGGYPANADPQIAPLHPFGILYAIAPPLSASTLEGILTPAFAGIGMLFYLRAVGCNRVGALLGALSFGLGGYITGHAIHPGLARAAAAIPWALTAIERLDSFRLTIGVAIAIAAIAVAGHPQGIAYALILVVLYALGPGRALQGHRIGFLSAGFLLGLGLSAGALLPAAELIGRSTRALGVTADMANPSLGWRGVAGLLTPFSYGGSIGPLYGDQPTLVGTCSVRECGGYPGMLVWIIALVALPRLVRQTLGRFWIAIAVIGLALALSPVDATDLGIRASVRLLVWWNLAMAAAVGLGLSALAKQAWPIGWSWIAILIMLVASVAVATSGLVPLRATIGWGTIFVASVVAFIVFQKRPGVAAFLVVILAADMAGFTLSMRSGVREAQHQAVGQVVRDVAEAQASLPPNQFQHARAVVAPLLIGANWASIVRSPIAQGYNPLIPISLARLLGQHGVASEIGMVGADDVASPKSHVLDLLRVGLVAVPSTGGTRRKQSFAESFEGNRRWHEIEELHQARLRFFRNERVRPVAWLVNQVRVVDDEEALRLIRTGGAEFEPEREALSDEALPVIPSQPGPTSGSVSVVRFDADEVRLAVETGDTAVLATSERYDPGWAVEIDGLPAELRRINFGFRGVVVPPGTHDIRFLYRPLVTRIGFLVSGLSLLALLGCCVVAATESRRQRSG